ncbi:hypothetical protein [uncultured Microbulbifer sp.]|uniref:hypothetical protein n=1 Tax=uncultured Microbulbifer sp. TaxID=348147 RepID=UPI0026135EEA|nr:hypothetical protein [uncultured Microbulbifer sp.]
MLAMDSAQLGDCRVEIHRRAVSKPLEDYRRLCAERIADFARKDADSQAAFQAALYCATFPKHAQTLIEALQRKTLAAINAVKALSGSLDIDSDVCDHPLVTECRSLYETVQALKSAGGDALEAVDLAEVQRELIELRDELLSELETATSRHERAQEANRRLFGAALSRVYKMGALLNAIEKEGWEIDDLLPPNWVGKVDFFQMDDFSVASLDPWEPLHSPNRHASVIARQCDLLRELDRASASKRTRIKQAAKQQTALRKAESDLAKLAGNLK